MKISSMEVFQKSIQTVQINLKFYSALVLLFWLGNITLIVPVFLMEKPSFLIAIILKLLELALYVKFAVTVHRSVLVNEVWQWKQIFSWQKYESLFFGMILVIGITAAISMAIVLFLISLIFGDAMEGNELLWVITMILIGGAIFTKICLIFPSTAIDNEMAIEDSIKVTRGSFINIFLLVVMLPIVTNIIGTLVTTEQLIWLNIISAFIFNLVLVFQITILSHIYQTILNNQPTKKPT